eukprot:jgi/Tetstr1/437617/TSEL_026284.t1
MGAALPGVRIQPGRPPRAAHRRHGSHIPLAGGLGAAGRRRGHGAGRVRVALDYQALLGVAGGTADLMAALDMLPEEGLACLAAAAFEVLFAGSQPRGEELFGEGGPPGDVAVRLWNHPGTLTTIRALKSSSIGTVVRVSRVKPLVTRMSFACGKCGEAAATAAFADGKFELPTRCPTLGCRGKSFAPVHSTAVRVQEVVGADRSDNGRVPRSVEVELRGDLVGQLLRGGRRHRDGGRQGDERPGEQGPAAAAARAATPGRLRAPCSCSIWMRSACAVSDAGGEVPTRGDIHVLLVGDPGQGKSQMLQATAAAAPRGLYVSANTSTNAGLTVSVVRDAVTGDYAFEAGALVLGDQGVCCVDEFDKMAGDHKARRAALCAAPCAALFCRCSARAPACLY